MYYGDSYNPNLPNDYDEPEFIPAEGHSADIHTVIDRIDTISENSVSQKVHRRAKNRKVPNTVLKPSEEGFCRIQTTMKTPTGSNIYIEYYYTKIVPGALIRNAVTGGYEYGYRVGSSDENLFFKVIRASGYDGDRDPHMLFYNSPEQYERHFMTTISQDEKERWKLKNLKEVHANNAA